MMLCSKEWLHVCTCAPCAQLCVGLCVNVSVIVCTFVHRYVCECECLSVWLQRTFKIYFGFFLIYTFKLFIPIFAVIMRKDPKFDFLWLLSRSPACPAGAKESRNGQASSQSRKNTSFSLFVFADMTWTCPEHNTRQKVAKSDIG
jgi:hypothetical protein